METRTVKKICIVVSTVFTAKAFLSGQIEELSRTYDVSLIANARGEEVFGAAKIRVIPAPIERQISPLSDLRALLRMFVLFRRNQFHAVHSVTPKAGLLAMLAAAGARVPVRIHTFTGQVWATRKGVSRMVLRMVDKLIAAAATHVIVDSPSQREFLLGQGVVTAQKSRVLGKGSISGVEVERFQPDTAACAAIRSELTIPPDGVMFLYVGRMNRDKGIIDLAAAFAALSRQRSDTWLVLVGPDEGQLRPRIEQLCRDCRDRLRLVEHTDRPEHFMAAADVFCLPSYREGFGSVIIEAAACGVPAIASRIYGITDAVVDGVTGMLNAPGDVAALTAAMAQLANDPLRRHALGEAARKRAVADFPASALTSALLGFYAKILN